MVEKAINFEEAALNELDRRAREAVSKLNGAWWDLGEVLYLQRQKFKSNNLYGAWLAEPGRDYYGKSRQTLTDMRIGWEFARDCGISVRGSTRGHGYDILRRISGLRDEDRKAGFIERLRKGEPIPVREVTNIRSEAKNNAIKKEVKTEDVNSISGLTKQQTKMVERLLRSTVEKTLAAARKIAEGEVKDRLMRALDEEKKAKQEREYWVNKNMEKPLLSKSEYRALLQCVHPDKGGNAIAFNAINNLKPYVEKEV